MKKHAPKILAIVLLTAIAVLTVIAGTGSFVDGSDSGNAQGDGTKSDVTTLPTTGVKDPEQELPAEQIPTVPEVPVEPSVFPVPPEESAVYAYTQSLPFESGFTLNAVHTTSEGVFIILTHELSTGGFKVKNRSVAVIKAERDGTLSAGLNLEHATATEYLDSALTSEGLVVITTSNSVSYANVVSLDLGSREILELPKADTATVFTLNKGYLLFTGGASNSVSKIENNVIKAKASLQSGEIKAVYDFNAYYTVFLNGINGYSVLKLDSSLRDLGGVSVPERRILAVQPVTRDGKQKYLVAEAKDGTVELAEYYADFSLSTAERVGVGMAQSADVFIKENRIFLLLYASTDRLYLIDEKLDYVASSSTVMQGMSALEDCASYDGGFNVLYIKGDTLVMLDLRDDGTEESRNFNVKTEVAFIAGLKGDGLSVVYADGNALMIIGLDAN